MTHTSKRRPASPRTAARCCRPIDQLLDFELFKALADPTRLVLLSCLAKCGRACSVGEIAECCSVDFSVVSRHLTTLARAKILDSIKQGRTVFYQVRFKELAERLRSLADAIEECDRKEGGSCCGGC